MTRAAHHDRGHGAVTPKRCLFINVPSGLFLPRGGRGPRQAVTRVGFTRFPVADQCSGVKVWPCRDSGRDRRVTSDGGRLTPHCTLAVTVALPLSVNVQVFVLFPPLEHAPDQMTSRLFVALSVIVVPVANDADPLLPTATLMPAGFEVTRSPPRPVAVTVRVAVCG